jgi:cysteine synthase A
VFVAGIGTGATLSGTGKYLKEQNTEIKIVGVEPKSSPMINKGYYGSHKIQGIGANFIPENYDASVVDCVYEISDEDAYLYAKKLAKIEGVLAGISSGASLKCAIDLALRKENEGKNIVVLLPDTGNRYLSDENY